MAGRMGLAGRINSAVGRRACRSRCYTVPMNVGTFIGRLSEQRLERVFNPYADRCPAHDRADAPGRRRANLRHYLGVLRRRPGAAVWIGRDLGYRGGRRTGLALVDEAHLGVCGARFDISLRRATVGAPVTERTAAAVWQALGRIEQPVACWNLFPFHPHPDRQPFGNRAHDARERDLGRWFLEAFLDLIGPEHLVAIGADAAEALRRFGHDCDAVRHPSYGGQRAFADGIAARYGLASRGAAAP